MEITAGENKNKNDEWLLEFEENDRKFCEVSVWNMNLSISETQSDTRDQSFLWSV